MKTNFKDIERELNNIKKSIPVNHDLKRGLREKFQDHPSRAPRKKMWGYIALVAVLCLAIILPLIYILPKTGGKGALAAELNVIQQISFLDIGGGPNAAPATWGNFLYIPIPNQGIYRLDMASSLSANSLTAKVVDASNVVFLSISHDGNQLAYATDQGVYVHDLRSGKTRAVVQNTESVYYEEPSWAPDNSHLLLTKKTVSWNEHGFDVKGQEIYEVSLDGEEMFKITDGSYASYSPDGSYIVLDREGKIIKLGMGADKSEQVISEGRFPSLSPDGLSIAYVKNSGEKKELKPNAFLQEDVSDVYIADMDNPSSTKKLTANYPLKFTSEEDWLNSLGSTGVPQTLVYTGAYSYFNPVWSSDSQMLYVLKSSSQGEDLRIMRIVLSTDKLQPEITVARWMQALINRDEDYARQLMLNPSDIPGSLTLSNPHPIGYVIGATGEEDGRVYVDARLYLAYTANPYLQVVKERFYLEKTSSGYSISQIKQLDDFQLYEREGTVYIARGGQKNPLFTIEDVKAIKNDVLRISSLAYDEQNKNIFFAAQTNGGLSIMAYKVDEKTFRDIVDIAGENTVAVDLSLSSNALYLAMNYGDIRSAHVFLYDLRNKKEMTFEGMNRASGAFWAGDLLVFKANYDGWFIRWQLDPKTGKITL